VVVHLHNFGFRDVRSQLLPTPDTNYFIASMSKAFTSAAIGILVEEGKVKWETRLKDILPGFHHNDRVVHEMATLVDLLAHRTGLQRADTLWLGAENKSLLSKEDTLETFNGLRPVKPFRDSFGYNNWGYALAGLIIEQLAGVPYADFIRQRILEPLGMARTQSGGKHEHLDNVAEAYQTLDDGSPFMIPRPHEDGKVIMEGASGTQSNVNDLLKFYRSILESSQEQFLEGKSNRSVSVLKQLPSILSGYQPMVVPSFREKSYGLAWARAEFPVPIGDIGTNPGLLPEMPSVGCEKPSLGWWHQGSLVGFTAFVALLPETTSAIVVLTNSTAFNDAADWVGQLVVEAVLHAPEKNDYVRLSRESSNAVLEKAVELEKTLEEQRIRGTKHKPLLSYTGKYFNNLGNFFLQISENDGQLEVRFQGRQSQAYKLSHYHNDVFSWYLPRNEQLKRGRWFITDPELYKVKFGGGDGKVDRLVWTYDSETTEGAVFRKFGSEPCL